MFEEKDEEKNWERDDDGNFSTVRGKERYDVYFLFFIFNLI